MLLKQAPYDGVKNLKAKAYLWTHYNFASQMVLKSEISCHSINNLFNGQKTM
jgi:hypothetical protein